MTTRLAPLLAVLCFAACGPQPPTVFVKLSAKSSDLAMFVRLRLVVRDCDAPNSITTEVPLGSDRLDLNVAIEPGHAVYVHAQGWSDCSNAMCTTNPQPGDCTCLQDQSPDRQRITREACSKWFRTGPEGYDLPELALEALAGRCPPPPLDSCSAPLP